MGILLKSITFCGVPLILACDGNCRKAWGINDRPEVQLSEHEDDTAYLSDGELGEAPADPGTYEGPDAKPTDYADPARQNKWCARQCERKRLVEPPGVLELPDFSGWVFNMHWRRDDRRG